MSKSYGYKDGRPKKKLPNVKAFVCSFVFFFFLGGCDLEGGSDIEWKLRWNESQLFDSFGQILATSHDRFTPKGSVLERKWDPENFREI